jgi:pimeloyl-ACP methyl ester carboxylesterase
MEECLQLRLYGDASLPALIYLPGLHGDWTLIGGFRQAVAGKVQFVEMTYPRSLNWSLDNYAAAVEAGLAQNGISRGWLLGESFGSQVLWAMAARGKFPAQGLILAGGFVRHPMRRMMRLMEIITGRISKKLFVRIIFGYAKIARFRYRHSPAVVATLDEFVSRRTEFDRRAAQHRLHLVAENDPSSIARNVTVPVFGLTGVLDPIVPWLRVRRWLRKNCPALRDFQIVRRADHNVLSTAPVESARRILNWIGSFTIAD